MYTNTNIDTGAPERAPHRRRWRRKPRAPNEIGERNKQKAIHKIRLIMKKKRKPNKEKEVAATASVTGPFSCFLDLLFVICQSSVSLYAYVCVYYSMFYLFWAGPFSLMEPASALGTASIKTIT